MSRVTGGASSSSSSSSSSNSSSAAASSSSSSSDSVFVLDIGSGFLKAGWSGEDAPRLVIPTVLLDHHTQALPAAVSQAVENANSQQRDYSVGFTAIQALQMSHSRLNSNTNSLSLVRPIERGEIKDWDAFTKLLDWVYREGFGINAKDFPVMLTVPPLLSSEALNEIAKIFFDVFNVPSLCVANQATLSLFSTGRTTGVVLEIGESISWVVPIYEGFSLRHAILSLPYAGLDITKNLQQKLIKRGFNFMDSQLDTVRDIKEKLCKVQYERNEDGNLLSPSAHSHTNSSSNLGLSTPTNGTGAENESENSDDCSYELPDGTMIKLDDTCRFYIYEDLFIAPASTVATSSSSTSSTTSSSSSSSARNYTSSGISNSLSLHYQGGIASMIVESLNMCDAYLRKDLLKNVVLAGGTAMAKGFGERMRYELKHIYDSAAAAAAAASSSPYFAAAPVASSEAALLNIITDSQRKYAAWIGASMYASLPTFGLLRVTQEQYKRDEAAVLKKFF